MAKRKQNQDLIKPEFFGHPLTGFLAFCAVMIAAIIALAALGGCHFYPNDRRSQWSTQHVVKRWVHWDGAVARASVGQNYLNIWIGCAVDHERLGEPVDAHRCNVYARAGIQYRVIETLGQWPAQKIVAEYSDCLRWKNMGTSSDKKRRKKRMRDCADQVDGRRGI